MEEPSAFPDLQELWIQKDPENMSCCLCHGKISPDPVIRTFRPYRPDREKRPFRHSKMITIPFGDDIILFDRHLKCLTQDNIKYSAISHVWDRWISEIQSSGKHLQQSAKVRQQLIELPLRIYDGLLKSGRLSPLDEMWYDYISVPQWSDEIKNRILLVMAEIFASAHITTIYAEDLEKRSLQLLYEGQGTEERLKGLTDICNLKWFSRVWTIMEYVRSNRVIVMGADYDIVSQEEDPIFMSTLHRVWNEEVDKHESVHQLEAKARIGENMVPWNLGTIDTLVKGSPVSFGQAFSILSRRRCSSSNDFLHALLGMVGVMLDQPQKLEFADAYNRTARLCLAAGDYSPLLVTPNGTANDSWDSWMVFRQGFQDVISWGLGREFSKPTYHGEFSFHNDDMVNGIPILKLQKVGIIQLIHEPFGRDPMTAFAQAAITVLKSTGPDMDAFISALGERLYRGQPGIIKQGITASGNMEALEHALHKQFDNPYDGSWPIDGPEGALWLAKVMTLSLPDSSDRYNGTVSRIEWLNTHGGTIHLSGSQNRLVSVTCPACRKTNVFRASLYGLASDLYGSTVYRIPGLNYMFAYPNGVCVLVKEGRIMGRMMWSTPACACQEMEMVKIQVPDLPQPSPRPNHSFG